MQRQAAAPATARRRAYAGLAPGLPRQMMQGIEVLDGLDENFWTKAACTLPGPPGTGMKPGQPRLHCAT